MTKCPFCHKDNDSSVICCSECAQRLPQMPNEVVGFVDGLDLELVEDSPIATPPPIPKKTPDEWQDERHVSGNRAVLARVSESTPTTATIELPAAASRSIHIKPVPDSPGPGLFASAKYLIQFGFARWLRRDVIKELHVEIEKNTAELGTILGTLGRQVRCSRLETIALAGENASIDAVDARIQRLEQEIQDLEKREQEENEAFQTSELEHEDRVSESQLELRKIEQRVEELEHQRRRIRDNLRDITAKTKSLGKAAKRSYKQAEKAQATEKESLILESEHLARQAADLQPEEQHANDQLISLEEPISTLISQREVMRTEVELAQSNLTDLKEGHRLLLAEFSAERGHKQHETKQANAEIERRLVTLGTIINLHRIEKKEFSELYEHVDEFHGIIKACSHEVNRLTAERESYDRRSLVRGGLVVFAGLAAVSGLIAILASVL